jgi:putative ABC transport system permease protein
MKFPDAIELAARSLRQSVLRNSLTTLGIAVGVASLVAMLSLGVGLEQMAGKRLKRSGLFDSIVVTSRREARSFNREQEESGLAPEQSPELDEASREKIARLPGVLEAYPDLRFVAELKFEAKPHLTLAAGLPFSARDSDALEGLEGRFFASELSHEVLVQKAFAAELLGKSRAGVEGLSVHSLAQALLGKQLVMRYAERQPRREGQDQVSYSVISREIALTIVGVTDLDPDSMRGAARARVFLPEKLLESMHAAEAYGMRALGANSDEPRYATVVARVRSARDVEIAEQAIRKLGFNTFSILDASKGLRRFFAILDVFLGIFGSLALTVASIGIVNTLLMAILERRREIGIMKAVGASDEDVRALFFVEAAVMGAWGGLFGIGLGWLIGHAINFGTNVYLQRQGFPPEQIWALPAWLAAGAVGFAIVVSLVSGLYPAMRAARVDPVAALRYS